MRDLSVWAVEMPCDAKCSEDVGPPGHAKTVLCLENRKSRPMGSTDEDEAMFQVFSLVEDP
jgi:hypothetical protein